MNEFAKNLGFYQGCDFTQMKLGLKRIGRMCEIANVAVIFGDSKTGRFVEITEIKDYILEKGVAINQIANHYGWFRQSLYTQLNGLKKGKAPSIDRIVKIANYLDIRVYIDSNVFEQRTDTKKRKR